MDWDRRVNSGEEESANRSRQGQSDQGREGNCLPNSASAYCTRLVGVGRFSAERSDSFHRPSPCLAGLYSQGLIPVNRECKRFSLLFVGWLEFENRIFNLATVLPRIELAKKYNFFAVHFWEDFFVDIEKGLFPVLIKSIFFASNFLHLLRLMTDL